MQASLLCSIYYTGLSSDFLSTEKELDALIGYLYVEKIIQDHLGHDKNLSKCCVSFVSKVQHLQSRAKISFT